MKISSKKKRFEGREEYEFFYCLGFRFFATTLRGHHMGHKRVMSAARDYLDVESIEDEFDRAASQFLVDVANMSRDGTTLEQLFDKWCDTASWEPGGSGSSVSNDLPDPLPIACTRDSVSIEELRRLAWDFATWAQDPPTVLSAVEQLYLARLLANAANQIDDKDEEKNR